MKLLTGRRAHVIAIAAALAAAALPAAAPASTPALQRQVTLEAGGVTFAPIGGFGCYSVPDPNPQIPADPESPPRPSLPLCADPGPHEAGVAVSAAAFPFTALLHFTLPPTTLTAQLANGDHSSQYSGGGTVAVAQVDADSWSLTLPTAVPDGTKVWFSANGGALGEFSNVFHLLVPAPPAPPLPPVVVQPQPSPQITLLGSARRGATVVVRLSTNVAGSVEGGVRQAGRARTLASTRVAAGRHRFVLAVPRPRTRAATVTLKLTDAGGRSVRVTRTLRRALAAG